MLQYKQHLIRVLFVVYGMKLALYENLKRSVAHLVKVFKIDLAPASTGRHRKITKLDALTLALYQHTSTRATKKSVWTDYKKQLKCSYKTLVVSMNEAGVVALRILFGLMRLNKERAHFIKYTDATDLPVCLKKNADKHKTMAGLAALGWSSKGWFYGLKMTWVRDHEGRLLNFCISPPSTNDRDLLKHMNADLYGLIIADAGYVSKLLEQEMHIEGKRWLLTKPYKSMKRLATWWQLQLYKGRFKIEFDFRSLKMFFGLITSLPRSVTGYFSNYFHAILAFTIR
jgi:transposase